MTSAARSTAVEVAERYYDSSDADSFYAEIWGGEDIHIGLYEHPEGSVRSASRATVDRILGLLDDVPSTTRVLDLGSGYGGTARRFVERFGCHVTCLNLSQAQNARNARLNAEQGHTERITIVHGNFEMLPFGSNEFDLVVSQDALLHSGRRDDVLAEVARVLKPRGRFVFTDPMQSDACPGGVLAPVLARLHLETLGSFAYYRARLAALGFEERDVVDLTPHLGQHYARVREELLARYVEMTRKASRDYVDRMLEGLEHWVTACNKGYLAWGILHFHAP